MAEPTVVVNNSTGSDTAASGAGPATALTGTNASFAGTPSVVTLDGSPDLTNVATDGSHVCWVKTSTGRQYSKITAKDNVAKTVTLADTLAGTATGRTWGIGGKRATLDHTDTRQLFRDYKSGWTIDIEQTGTDYTLTSALLMGVDCSGSTYGRITSSSATRPIITSSTSGVHLFDITNGNSVQVQNLHFTHTGATRGRGILPVSSAINGVVVRNCIFDGCFTAIEADNQVFYQIGRLSVSGCEIKNCTDDGLSLNGQGNYITDCYIHDNVGDGIRIYGDGTTAGAQVINCVLEGNGGYGYRQASANNISLIIDHCTFIGNTQSGILTGSSNANAISVRNCIFYNNGRYGLEMGSSSLPNYDCNYNAFGGNALGARLTFVAGPNDITLTANPFNSASDFGLNSTAGGGAAAKAAAARPLNASDNPAGDVGAIPSGGGSAGSFGSRFMMTGVGP